MATMTERENALLAFQHQDTPWVPSPSVFEDTCIPTVIEESARGYGITTDWFGVKYLYREDQPGPMPLETEPFLEDIEEWREKCKMPDLDAYDWEGCAAIDTANWDRKNKISNCILVNGCFESLHMFRGFVEALCDIQDEDCIDDASDFMGWIADYKIKIIERVHKYYKPDMIQFHDDYANALNLFMDIPKWRKIIRPHLKRVVDCVKGLGMIYQHHSCGKVRDLIPDLIDVGIEALNPIQAQNDPVEVKRLYADRLTPCGGFDNVRVLDNPDATDAQIRDSINETLYAMAPGGKWIALCSFLDKFPEREAIWLDCLDEYNRPLMEKAGVPFVKHERSADYQSIYNLAKGAAEAKKKKEALAGK